MKETNIKMNTMDRIMIRAAMPGNPSFYEGNLQDYSLDSLKNLKEYGINTVFINLAWSRPHIDVVCLEHCAMSKTYPLVSDSEAVSINRKKLKIRLANIKQLGMRAMILAGIPMYRDYCKLPEEYQEMKGQSVSLITDGAVTCIKSPAVMRLYRELVDDLLENLPELDGMLVYTYDELAEVCGEDGDCPRCHGIPQEVRISEFLNNLFAYAQEKKEGFSMWWEPWELAWMQVYGILERLDKKITVSCHSTLHEVYFANHPDLWFRSIAALCREQGRGMIGELFLGGTGEDTGFTPAYPCPRLVMEQILTTAQTSGVIGIKEYYGICTPYISVNELAMKAAFEGRTDLDAEIAAMAEQYCMSGRNELIAFWELGSRILELFPWELSWVLRQYNCHPYDQSYWGKIHFLDMMKTPWNTPSWLANRRSYYMISADRSGVTDTYTEDLMKRFECVEALLAKGIGLIGQVQGVGEYQRELDLQLESFRMFRILTICRKNHLKLSLEMESLGRGADNLGRIAEVLDAEQENAKALLELIRNSEVPYLLSEETINGGLEEIELFRKELLKGKDCLLKTRGGSFNTH